MTSKELADFKKAFGEYRRTPDCFLVHSPTYEFLVQCEQLLPQLIQIAENHLGEKYSPNTELISRKDS